jgi:predicted DCC family thiol-disulfide oxidoreductase YuxK
MTGKDRQTPCCEKSELTQPIVFYDGGCPLCRREIGHYLRIDNDQRINWVDVNDAAGLLDKYDLTYEQAMRRMHVVDSDGSIVSGVDAFAVLWRHLPRYRWLSIIVSMPGVRWLGEQLYSLFARRRYQARCGSTCS